MAVSLSDSPLSTAEPDDLIDMTSAERRLAASSKLDEVRVEDSKKRFTTVRPLSVGSFFTSRSSDRPKARASESSRSTRLGGRSSSRSNGRTSAIVPSFLGLGDEQDAVDLVDLDELHLDALAAGRGQVLAHVVRADRKLAMAPVDEAGKLYARGPSVLEDRLDRRSDRPSGRENVVDEHARHALQLEVEPRRADDRLGVARGLAVSHHHVVAVKGDVDCPERDFDPAA